MDSVGGDRRRRGGGDRGTGEGGGGEGDKFTALISHLSSHLQQLNMSDKVQKESVPERKG